jgi:hypothetical protein
VSLRAEYSFQGSAVGKENRPGSARDQRFLGINSFCCGKSFLVILSEAKDLPGPDSSLRSEWPMIGISFRNKY